MCEVNVAGKTAMARKATSVPMRHWINRVFPAIPSKYSDFDLALNYGAGKAYQDDAVLASYAKRAMRYDPNHGSTPGWYNYRFDCIVCNYVVNVLPPKERASVWWELSFYCKHKGQVLVAARGDTVKGTPLYDGVRTSKGTLQKTYTAQELEAEALRYFGWVQVEQRNGVVYAICREPKVNTALVMYS